LENCGHVGKQTKSWVQTKFLEYEIVFDLLVSLSELRSLSSEKEEAIRKKKDDREYSIQKAKLLGRIIDFIRESVNLEAFSFSVEWELGLQEAKKEIKPLFQYFSFLKKLR